jgi:cobalt-zinc-cadmium efflux system protein
MNKIKKPSRLALAFFLNLGFAVLEFFGGLFTNSMAILSDSIHDLGDSVSIGLSWFMDFKSRKKPDRDYTYGYARYSLLGALISSLVLLVGSTIIIVEAIRRLLSPEGINAVAMIPIAVVGILVNGIAAYTTAKGKSLSEKAVSLHLFEDVFGWVAVLVGAIAMAIWDLPLVDSLISLGMTLYILFEVFKNIKTIIEVFLEKSPAGIDFETIRKDLLTTEGVTSIHHVHVWTLEGKIHLVTLHAMVAKGTEEGTYLAIQRELHRKLEKAGLEHATIEIEYDIEGCHPSDFETEGYCPDSEEDGHHHS